jgi:hypothetical protein
MKALLVGAIVGALLAACGQAPGAVFQTTLSNPTGESRLPVTLADRTGLVVGIGPAEFDSTDFRDAGILADPTGPNAFIVTWLGGMCDSDTALVLSPTAAGHDLHIVVHGGFGSCPGAGVLRGLRVETSKPLDLGLITISGSKTIQLILEEDCGPLRAAETGDAKVACLALLQATIGERTDEFASVTVRPADGACPGDECSTAAGIEAQAWRVEATDRKAGEHAWRCTYRAETASCVVVAAP